MILMSANSTRLCERDKIYNLIAAVEYPQEDVKLKFLFCMLGEGNLLLICVYKIVWQFMWPNMRIYGILKSCMKNILLPNFFI